MGWGGTGHSPSHYSFLLFNNFTYLYIFGCAGSSLLREFFSSCGETGTRFCCSALSSHCGGFPCYRAQALGYSGVSSCSPWAQ